jgi:hypothetical protein
MTARQIRKKIPAMADVGVVIEIMYDSAENFLGNPCIPRAQFEDAAGKQTPIEWACPLDSFKVTLLAV